MAVPLQSARFALTFEAADFERMADAMCVLVDTMQGKPASEIRRNQRRRARRRASRRRAANRALWTAYGNKRKRSNRR